MPIKEGVILGMSNGIAFEIYVRTKFLSTFCSGSWSPDVLNFEATETKNSLKALAISNGSCVRLFSVLIVDTVGLSFDPIAVLRSLQNSLGS